MPPRNRPIRPSRVPEVPQPARTGTKGRPTPKRRQAEEARRTPLVRDPRTAKKDQRAQERADREKVRQALMTNDERNYPFRDRGPARRWVRDYVDSKRTWREYLMPIALGLMALTFLSALNVYVAFVVTSVTWLLLLGLVISSWLYVRRIKRLAIAKFGEQKVPERIGMYGLMRAFQSRRARLPKPEVERGGTPR